MLIRNVIATSYRNCTHFDVDSSWKCNPAYQGPNMPQWLCHWRGRYPGTLATSSCEKFGRKSTTKTRVKGQISRGVQNLYACLLKTSPRARTHWKRTYFLLAFDPLGDSLPRRPSAVLESSNCFFDESDGSHVDDSVLCQVWFFFAMQKQNWKNRKSVFVLVFVLS